jgi:6-phosphogluconate dehydrogenase
MAERRADIGMIGLGVMGRNLMLNIADHGFTVTGFDKDMDKVDALDREGDSDRVLSARDLGSFMDHLATPRAVMLLVPAGKPVDSVLDELEPHLERGDVIIDGGNSHFPDTDRRSERFAGKGIHYLGMGVSGGEAGARRGPSMMPGGPREGYEQVREILQAAAAKVDGEPCVTWLGPGSAGHYVKMVHNGIEYGLMELIAESYDLMGRGLGLDNRRLHLIYEKWSEGDLNGFLMEITADIFAQKDDKTDGDLIDVILDAARQKGTGMWTSASALDLQVPAPNIDIAVIMRDLSARDELRRQVAAHLGAPKPSYDGDSEELVQRLEGALLAAFVVTFAQGMALLSVASEEREYSLDLEAVARIWRGGCIIRAALLRPIRAAYARRPDLPNLLLDDDLAATVMDRQDDLRAVVAAAASMGIPAPGLMNALGYLDALRSARLPANLIQAQRDYFGSHTYERVDAEGTFHTQWRRD